MMLLTILLFVVAVATSFDLAAPIAAASSNSPYVPLPDETDASITNPTYLNVHEMKVGSPCYGLEGEWNCMTTTFQRCASGQWSVVMGTAYGTVCEPVGFTYDFQPAFASWFPPADTTQTITCVATATATGGPDGVDRIGYFWRTNGRQGCAQLRCFGAGVWLGQYCFADGDNVREEEQWSHRGLHPFERRR